MVVGEPAPASDPAYPGTTDGATTKPHVWRPTAAGYWTGTMSTSRSIVAASLLLSSSESLHHWREDDECPGVDRDRYQNQYGQHEASRDQYAPQRRGGGRLSVVDPAVRLDLLHDEGLPGGGRCHTFSLSGYRSTRG